MQLKLERTRKEPLPLYLRIMFRVGIGLPTKRFGKRGRYNGGKHEARARLMDVQTHLYSVRRKQLLQKRHARHNRAAWTFKPHETKMLRVFRRRATAEGVQL